MGPEDLQKILSHIPRAEAPAELLVGLATPDDAAVYRLDAERALVATLDFFTPLVDGPEDFGSIAAANALSDLYAMGAEPLLALNILAVPSGGLPDEVVAGILQGASETCAEAGVVVAGGHSIDDPEPKFGLVAIGLAHPDRLWRKTGARAGDELVLGKALGTGVVTTGIKRGEASAEAAAAAIASMRQLNRGAAGVLETEGPHAVTDVTGYGLLGHLLEVCRASEVAAEVWASAPARLPGAEALAAGGCVPGGTGRNRRAAEAEVAWDDAVDEVSRTLLCDAQTSGGLLAAVAAGRGEPTAAALREAGYAAAVVGRLEEPEAGGPRVRVRA